ncbi:MAG: hypothetical protein ABSE79_18190 [Terriglobia bacterium]|jgi:hypothetical protein
MAQRDSSRTTEASPRLPGSEGTHSDDGVDLTLIRWMLSLTPAERLQVLQQSVKSLLRLRDGDAKS